MIADTDVLTVKDFYATGKNAEFFAWFQKNKDKNRGALLAKIRSLSLGISIDNDKTDWKIVNAQRWYDDILKKENSLPP